jgi:hypothetical protein
MSPYLVQHMYRILIAILAIINQTKILASAPPDASDTPPCGPVYQPYPFPAQQKSTPRLVISHTPPPKCLLPGSPRRRADSSNKHQARGPAGRRSPATSSASATTPPAPSPALEIGAPPGGSHGRQQAVRAGPPLPTPPAQTMAACSRRSTSLSCCPSQRSP